MKNAMKNVMKTGSSGLGFGLGFGIAAITTAVIISGCSKTNEYAPAAEADGKAIFDSACVGCHEPKAEDIYFELAADKATPAAIKEKITNGSLGMPSFPNIKGEQLDQLSAYVITVSKTK